MIDYKNFGENLIRAFPQSRTASGDLGGQKIWIKRPVPPKARIWHKLQKLFATLFQKPILRATVSEGGSANLYAEAERLRLFKQQGFHVPNVLAVYDSMLVMDDAGPQLRAALDGMHNRATREQVLIEAIRTMAILHKAGLAHGRPYMRDMTWDGEKIGFLDLEEDPVKVMPLPTSQARDIWIFLSAASRYARTPANKKQYEDPLILELFGAYKKENPDEAIHTELKTFVLWLSPLRHILEVPALWDIIGTDARQSVFINRCLEKALKTTS